MLLAVTGGFSGTDVHLSSAPPPESGIGEAPASEFGDAIEALELGAFASAIPLPGAGLRVGFPGPFVASENRAKPEGNCNATPP